MLKRRAAAVLCAAALSLASLAGCQGRKTAWQPGAYPSDVQFAAPDTTVLAENGRYRLELDSESMGVTLTEFSTGNRWGTSPERSEEVELDEFGLPVTRHPQVESPVVIEYLDVSSDSVVRTVSYTGAVRNNSVSCTAIDNGIRIEYYFSGCQIMIPVEYRLREDSLLISIDPKSILEGDMMLLSVTVAPFWCSAENTAADSYLMFPSGSGTLIYPREISQAGESYSASVYGDDASMEIWDRITTEKAVRLPVFGVRSGERASLAVIESGAESASVNATVGATSFGYSSVYASFQLRGYTQNSKQILTWGQQRRPVYAESMIDTVLSIGFYPLTGEEADYSGMAARYREYLGERRSDTDSVSRLDLTFVGGTMIAKSFLGIPYETLYPTATLSEVREILDSLYEAGVQVSNVTLVGYGKTGLDPSEVAGGFTVAKRLGKTADLETVFDLCTQHGTRLFYDVDLVDFASSGNGFSLQFDSAVRANRKLARQYTFHIATLSRNEDTYYSLLARDRLSDCVDKLLKKTGDWKLSGIGLSSLSSVIYSDYSSRTDTSFYSAAGMADQTVGLMQRIAESGRLLMTSEANAYAAALSDAIYNTPTTSAGVTLFDADIPFYQMVFRGRNPISCESLNLVSNPRTQLLRAIESGCGLSYTLTAEYDNDLINSSYPVFYNSVYGDLRENLLAAVGETADYFAAVSGASIVSHTVYPSGLRETVFDNGAAVYVNYGSETVDSPAGEVQPEGYLLSGAAS